MEGVVFDTRHVKYPSVSKAFDNTGVLTSDKPEECQVVWWDGNISQEDFYLLLPFQRINKIPGMDSICYKSNTFMALNSVRNKFPKLIDFIPHTFIMPYQFSEFQHEHIKKCNQCRGSVTWIVKPRSGCCGTGIHLIQNAFDLADCQTPAIVQSYIRPYLINGFKFDFRFYLFIPTLKPFTAFIYHEGIARFCTQKYRAPTRQTLDDKYAHLTNTAVNVGNSMAQNSDFTKLASSVLEEIKSKDKRGAKLWDSIKRAASLTLASIYAPTVTSILNHNVERRTQAAKRGTLLPKDGMAPLKRYFHIIGIDVIINDACQPIVLELNDRPSLCITFDMEAKLKPQMISDALKMITNDGSAPPKEATSGWEKLMPCDASYSSQVHTILSAAREELKPRLEMLSQMKKGTHLPRLRRW